MAALIIFLKAHVKAHSRTLASGRVVHVAAHNTRAPSARSGENDVDTGDLFDALPDRARGKGVPGAAPVKHVSPVEAARHDLLHGETLALFFDPQHQHEKTIEQTKPVGESKPLAASVDENSSINKELVMADITKQQYIDKFIADNFPAAEPAATPALTDDQRNKIAKDDTLLAKYGTKGEGSRGIWKEAARGGKFDHLWTEHLANEKAAEDAEKSRKRAKNDAWREKNMPKLVAAKNARIQMEDGRREADRQYAERQARINENVRQRIADENSAMAEAERKQDASYRVAKKPAGNSLPTSGRVSSDDPSIYGSWLLGHEGELWSRVRVFAPQHTDRS